MESKTKNFIQEITTIQEIENLSQNVTISSMNGKSHISKIKKEFKLLFNGVFQYPINGAVDINIKGISYNITSLDFDTSFRSSFHDVPCEHTFDIDDLSRGIIEGKTQFRMFFFDTSKSANLFHFKLESPKYDGIIPWAFNCTRVNIGMSRYDIVQHKQDEISYIIIENLDPVSLECFKKDSYAIQKGIGFLCGYMPGGEHYIFSGSDFQYSRLAREALKSIYFPVTSNPYSFLLLQKHKDISKHYETLLTVLPSSVISTLVSQIKNSEELSVAILFLMEVSHMKSIVSMPGVLSVILESLANVIINPILIKTKLIADEKLAEQIIDDLNQVLDKYKAKLDTEAIIKIKRRLTALNHPINTKKITNAMKLREPFDQLGIALSASDEKAIEYRNALLHGNILMNANLSRSSKEIDDHMLFITAKLYTLISKLILKSCGYNGYVINQAKFYNYSNADNEIEYFELI